MVHFKTELALACTSGCDCMCVHVWVFVCVFVYWRHLLSPRQKTTSEALQGDEEREREYGKLFNIDGVSERIYKLGYRDAQLQLSIVKWKSTLSIDILCQKGWYAVTAIWKRKWFELLLFLLICRIMLYLLNTLYKNTISSFIIVCIS